MSVPASKEEETAQVNAKNIIANFEKWPAQSDGGGTREVEKPASKPGAAKKLLQAYEEKSKPEPEPEISRTGKRPTFGGAAVAMNGTGDDVKEGAKAPRYTVLLVFGHMEMKSFNGRLFEESKQLLEGQGHKVMNSDLYAMDWRCPSRADTGGKLGWGLFCPNLLWWGLVFAPTVCRG